MSARDFMAEWTAQSNARHAAQVAEGEHDDACEYRDNGHFLCNCRGRKRIAAGFTTPPGQLIHNYPTCPKCYGEVSHDGNGYVCDTCEVQWDSSDDGDEGSFMYDNEPLDVAEWDRRHAPHQLAGTDLDVHDEQHDLGVCGKPDPS